MARASVITFFLLSLMRIANASHLQRPIANAEKKHQRLHVTAIRNGASDPHDSYLQCLRLPEAFNGYPTVGSSIALSSVSNITMVVLPPHSEEGWHRPPAPMWFFLLRGAARVVTPSTGDEVWIEPSSTGKGRQECQGTLMSEVEVVDSKRKARVERQAVMALDVQGKGHLTFYPGKEETVALQVPLSKGWEEWLDSLEVVAEGPC